MPTPETAGPLAVVLDQLAIDVRGAAGWPESAKVYETERRLPSVERGYATIAMLPLVYAKGPSACGTRQYRATFRLRWRFEDGQARLREEMAVMSSILAIVVPDTPGFRYAGVGSLPEVTNLDPTDYEDPAAPGHDLAADVSMTLSLP